MFCDKCGAEANDGSRFCPNCGAELSGAAAPQNVCPSCGSAVSDTARFCDNCGQPLDGGAGQSVGSATSVQGGRDFEDAQARPKGKGGVVIILLVVVAIAVAAFMVIRSCTSDPRMGEPMPPDFDVEPPVTIRSGPSEVDASKIEIPKSSWDATERPGLEEFSWLTDEMVEGMPANATPITSFSDICGTWKGYIQHAREEDFHQAVYDYLTFSVYGTEEDAGLIADWYETYHTRPVQVDKREDEPDTVYTGAWDKDGLTLSGGGVSIHLTTFYELDGRQYAVGTMDGVGEDTRTWIAMVRP